MIRIDSYEVLIFYDSTIEYWILCLSAQFTKFISFETMHNKVGVNVFGHIPLCITSSPVAYLKDSEVEY